MSACATFSRFTMVFLLLLTGSTICAGQDNKKFEYAILVDNTGSMRSQFEVVLNLTKRVVHQIHDHGPVSIYRFHGEGIGRGSRAVPAAVTERAQDEDRLNRAVENIYVEGGQTTLLDAIDLMDEQLKQPPAATDKIIILITDGEDRVSHITQKEVAQRLTASKTVIYAIGLVQELQGDKRSKATDLLKSLAKETGGRAVLPKQSTDLAGVLNELAIPPK